MSRLTCYLPGDSGAVALGADEAAAALTAEAQRLGLGLELVRTGSRGAYWLEPMLEHAGPAGRTAFGPVTPADAPGLLQALAAGGGADHPLALGPPGSIPYLASQDRVTFHRCGVVDPCSIEDYRAHGGLRGLDRALSLNPTAIVDEVAEAGLRGRGGAAFPTGIKWRTVLEQPAQPKYIVCNADEGDSGTFADRMIMEGDPFLLIEGMVIAGLATGAEHGYIYLRAEYPHARAILGRAITAAYAAGLLGSGIANGGHRFDLEIRLGAESYVCGEETALMESLEGRRGQVRPKPPLPAIHGLFGQPTVVNNVLSLAAIPAILAEGGAAYHAHGTGRSRGTLALQLAGNVRRPGLVEKAFGLTLRDLIDGFGGGTASGRPVRAVQVGGPMGAYLPDSLLDTPLDYEALTEAGGTLGHGGVVVFDDSVDMARQARNAMRFCADESCGKCTPCRVGSVRGTEILERFVQRAPRPDDHALLADLCTTMTATSLCALGGMAELPVMSACRHFPEDFAATQSEASGC